MPSVRYTNVNGQIIAEKRGGSRSFYGADPLGSTVALYDSSGNATDTFAYWAYGEVRTSTGSTATPFKFCGIWGYYGDATGRTYVRARFYRDKIAKWGSQDHLWPHQMPFAYCKGDPISFIDPSGNFWIKCGRSCSKAECESIVAGFNYLKEMYDHGSLAYGMLWPFFDCICRSPGPPGWGMGLGVTTPMDACLDNLFNGVSPQIDLIVECNTKKCNKSRKCGQGVQHHAPPPSGTITLCWPGVLNHDCGVHCTLLHEMIHVCGALGELPANDFLRCVTKVPGCGVQA